MSHTERPAPARTLGMTILPVPLASLVVSTYEAGKAAWLQANFLKQAYNGNLSAQARPHLLK
jgi:hypothetical protein